jgi:hypothetical protein
LVGEIVVCTHGLRWRVGKSWDSALWADVKSAFRWELTVMRAGLQVGDRGTLTIVLKDGRKMRFERYKISDFETLANTVHATLS